MIRERLAGMFRKGRKDKGSMLLSTLVLIVMLTGVAHSMASSTHRTIQNASDSRELIETGQLADQALQDATFTLNSTPNGPFPTQASPKTKTTDRGTWEWYASPVVDGLTGRTSTITATGIYQGVKKSFSVRAGAPLVGGFKVGPGGHLSYELSPKTAFGHVLMGNHITAQNGIGTGGAETFLKGPLGLLGNGPITTTTFPGLPSQKDVSYMFYGPATNSADAAEAVRVPAGVFLDEKLVTDNMSRCGTTPKYWKASEHGNVLVANGNVGCYAQMVFDVPTTIVGAGAFNAFVSGEVIFRADVTVPDGAALNIYTNTEWVDFYTEAAHDTSLDVANTFIYAPKGQCRTQPFRSTLKPLNFSGSMACKEVEVAGKFTGKAPVNPLGAELYENNIWYLTDYRQESGTRG